MRNKGVFVTGIDTGVGKTVVASGLAGALKSEGFRVSVMKPVQSGALQTNDGIVSQDAEFLRTVSGCSDSPDLVNPYRFAPPLSPYHAARSIGSSIDPGHIVSCFHKLRGDRRAVVVEGAGGLMVPLTESFLIADLIWELDLPVLVVAHPFLGTINHTLLTVSQAQSRGLNVVGIVVNQCADRDYPEPDFKIIEKNCGVPVLGFLAFSPEISVEEGRAGDLVHRFKKSVRLEGVYSLLREGSGSGEREKWIEKDKRYVWHPFTQMKDWLTYTMPVIDSASGVRLKDVDGTIYYDGHSSYWANVHGHNHRALNQSVIRQLHKVAHSTLFGMTNTAPVALAEKLVRIAPKGLGRVFYSDDGSTAVEVALKMAFQYWKNRGGGDGQKKKFVCLGNAYHGDTLGSVGVGRIDLYHGIFKSLLFDSFTAPAPYCYRCPLGKTYPDCRIACVEELGRIVGSHKGEIAALILEPLVQCPGGMITAPEGYLKRAREICRENDVLLIADEVAVGLGRTGRMFACEHEGVTPDILTLSKGITGGYMPLGVTLTTERIFEAFLGEAEENKTFYHGHTFTGYALGCAVALRNLELFEEEDLVRKTGEKARLVAEELNRFRTLSHVGDVRQRGLIVGIELVRDRTGKIPYPAESRMGRRVVEEAKRRGLIVRPLGDVLVFFPALAASEEDLRAMLRILYDSISSVTEAG